MIWRMILSSLTTRGTTISWAPTINLTVKTRSRGPTKLTSNSKLLIMEIIKSRFSVSKKNLSGEKMKEIFSNLVFFSLH